MKNSSIRKINVAGLVGYIISIILIVCSIASMVGVGIATAGAIAISKEDINVRVSTNVDVDSSGDFFGKLNSFIGIDGVEDLNDLIDEKGAVISVDDRDISNISVKRQDNGLIINAQTNDVTFSMRRVIVALVAAFIFLGSVTVMLYMLKSLMKALKNCTTPFADDVIRRMTRFANSLIPVIVLNMVSSGIWSSLTVNSGFSFSLNIGGILLVAVVYLLVAIFRHGAQLQRESDETL